MRRSPCRANPPQPACCSYPCALAVCAAWRGVGCCVGVRCGLRWSLAVQERQAKRGEAKPPSVAAAVSLPRRRSPHNQRTSSEAHTARSPVNQSTQRTIETRTAATSDRVRQPLASRLASHPRLASSPDCAASNHFISARGRGMWRGCLLACSHPPLATLHLPVDRPARRRHLLAATLQPDFTASVAFAPQHSSGTPLASLFILQSWPTTRKIPLRWRV